MIMIRPGLPTRVRRFVALLTLACGGWIQALALDCPMVLPTNSSADASAHATHAPEVHAATDEAAAPPHQERSNPHSTPGCMLMMGCGATAEVAPRLVGTAVGARTVSSPTLFGTSGYTTAYPAYEPPPPRLPV